MIHQSNTREWTKSDGGYLTPEGLLITEKEMKDICTYHAIPATLINVDKKFRTNTLFDVIKVAAPSVGILSSEDQTSIRVLDPKSKFLEDREFDLLLEEASERTGVEFDIHNNGFSKRASFKVKPTDTDSFVGDLFEKSFTIERLPQGGVNLATALLRLACTNGMVVPDAQYKALIRSANVESTQLTAFADSVKNFNIEEYFRSLFFKNGEAVHASVSDYIGMQKTLATITDDPDFAKLLLPTADIEAFYTAQGIDISKMSSRTLNRLPSGLRYYEAYNILTHGAKSAEKTLENEIKVANWCRPSYLSQVKDSDVTFSGMPTFDRNVVKERMGDLK